MDFCNRGLMRRHISYSAQNGDDILDRLENSYSGYEENTKTGDRNIVVEFMSKWCRMVALVQFTIVVILYFIFNVGDPTELGLSSPKFMGRHLLDTPINITQPDDSLDNSIISKNNAYTERFRGQLYKIGSFVILKSAVEGKQASKEKWLFGAQMNACSGQIVDISSASGNTLYLVVVYYWSGDASFWMSESDIQVIGEREVSNERCVLPYVKKDRPTYKDEMYSSCSQKIREFCANGHLSHNITSKMSSFNCYPRITSPSSSTSPIDNLNDFYLGQDLIASSPGGYCPYTNQLKWSPDSITHPKCSYAIKNQSAIDSLSYSSHIYESVTAEKHYNILTAAQMAASQQNGYCPNVYYHMWVPNAVIYPKCDEALHNSCSKHNMCNVGRYGWTKDTRSSLFMEQEWVSVRGACPYPAIASWTPSESFFPSCQSSMRAHCTTLEEVDVCADNSMVALYHAQEKASELNECVHPEAYRWPYATIKETADTKLDIDLTISNSIRLEENVAKSRPGENSHKSLPVFKPDLTNSNRRKNARSNTPNSVNKV